jgi:hypothetical protein
MKFFTGILAALVLALTLLAAPAGATQQENNGNCPIEAPDKNNYSGTLDWESDGDYSLVILVGGPPNQNNQDPDGRDKKFIDVKEGDIISRVAHNISHICTKDAPAVDPEPEPDPDTDPEPETPREYECDGTGDGVNEHDYDDPSDGVCAEEAPQPEPEVAATPVAEEPAVEAPAVEAPAETLPVTGGSAIITALVGLVSIASGFGLKRWAR